MGRASRSKQAPARQQKIAAQRAAERRRQVRTRVLTAAGSVVVIIAIVVGLVVAYTGRNSATAKGASNGPTGVTLSKVVSDVTNVPASTLDKVGIGSVTSKPTSVTGPALTSGGRPEMLYIGAEYCPFCAAERWAMIVALSRFGTFSGLHTVHSASNDPAAPNTPTFTFYGSHYTSKYLTFTPVEETTNIPQGNSYTPLQQPTSQQQALMNKYDSGGSIPFIDVGNKYVQIGDPQGLDPKTLDGKSWTQIAQALQDPSSPIAQEIDGAANQLTAAIVKVTGHQPAGMSSQTLKSLEASL
jgi:thiol-disulfide isomerase/thioredoxin